MASHSLGDKEDKDDQQEEVQEEEEEHEWQEENNIKKVNVKEAGPVQFIPLDAEQRQPTCELVNLKSQKPVQELKYVNVRRVCDNIHPSLPIVVLVVLVASQVEIKVEVEGTQQGDENSLCPGGTSPASSRVLGCRNKWDSCMGICAMQQTCTFPKWGLRGKYILIIILIYLLFIYFLFYFTTLFFLLVNWVHWYY